MTTMTKAAETKTGLIQATAFDSSLVTEWIDFAQVKPASERSYRKGIKNFWSFCAARNIVVLNRETLLQYRTYLDAKDEEGKNIYAAATRNLYVTSVKLFVTFLHQEGYLPTNPAEHLKGFKVDEGHSKSALSAEQVKTIAANFNTSTLKGKRDLAMFALMSTCGLRCVEVQRANIEDFEVIGGVIRLHVQGKGRDDKKEAVNIPAGVYQLIQNWLDARGDVAVTEPLFCSLSRNNFNGQLSTVSISRIVKGAMKDAGYNSDRLTAHSLRHTAATTAIKAGASIREVQESLRHKRISVTQVYLHELDGIKNSATTRAASVLGF